MLNKRYLYLLAGLIWGIPGVMITIKGIRAYFAVCANELWWLGLITAAVLISFNLMFYRIVNKYCALIASKPERTSIWHTFPVRGWVLVVCMSCLGIVLKFVPYIPIEFIASFYSGLGPSLVVAGCLFVKKMSFV